MIPACVIAGVVIVGDIETPDAAAPAGSIAFARPKSNTFTVPSASHLDVGGLEIAVDDPLVMCRFQRVGDLSRDGQRFIDWNRALRDAIRERQPLDKLHDEGSDPISVSSP